MLRSIGELPPEQRGPVGKAANEVSRRSRRCCRARPRRSRPPSWTRGWARTAIDVTLPGDPPQPAGHLHLITADPARDRGRLRGPRLLGGRGARGRVRLLQLHRAQPPARPPGADAAGHLLLRPSEVLLRTHTSPMQVRAMEAQEPPIYIVVPGQGLPARLRRHAHADVPPGRGPGDRRGHHAGRPPGRAARVRAGDVRRASARCGCARTTSRSPSRAWRSTSRASAAAARAAARRLALTRSARARAGSRSSARGWSTRTCSASWPRTATTPRRSRASRSAWASSASRCSRHGVPDLRAVLRQRRALPGAVRRHEGPARLAARVLRPGPRRPRRSPSGST